MQSTDVIPLASVVLTAYLLPLTIIGTCKFFFARRHRDWIR